VLFVHGVLGRAEFGTKIARTRVKRQSGSSGLVSGILKTVGLPTAGIRI
jgi:hypothetical protein